MRILCGLLLIGISAGLVVAVDSPPPAPAELPVPDLTGEWSGYWVSTTKKGHSGPLKATFLKIHDGCYSVKFKGRFAKVIPFHYTTRLTVVGSGNGTIQFAGEQPLGPVFGKFCYSATATDTNFDATFSAAKDAGKFVLTRCCSGK
jgi:hypothetical protein